MNTLPRSLKNPITQAQKQEIMTKLSQQYHKLSPQTIETVEREMERLFPEDKRHTNTVVQSINDDSVINDTVIDPWQPWETVIDYVEHHIVPKDSKDKAYPMKLKPMAETINYQNEETPKPIGYGTKTTITLEYYTPGSNADYAEMTSLILRDHIQKVIKQAKHISTYKLNRTMDHYQTR